MATWLNGSMLAHTAVDSGYARPSLINERHPNGATHQSCPGCQEWLPASAYRCQGTLTPQADVSGQLCLSCRGVVRDGLWIKEPPCAGRSELFFPEERDNPVKGGAGSAYKEAREICLECPLVAKCLVFAFKAEPVGDSHKNRYGMYGSLDPRERADLAKKFVSAGGDEAAAMKIIDALRATGDAREATRKARAAQARKSRAMEVFRLKLSSHGARLADSEWRGYWKLHQTICRNGHTALVTPGALGHGRYFCRECSGSKAKARRAHG